jgi:hypothetical protein
LHPHIEVRNTMFPSIQLCGTPNQTNPYLSISTIKNSLIYINVITNIIIKQPCKSAKHCIKRLLTSRLNSSSASKVQTFTGKDFPVFFLRNGDILIFRYVYSASRINYTALSDYYRKKIRDAKSEFATLPENVSMRRPHCYNSSFSDTANWINLT